MAIRVYHESSVGQPTVTALQCNSSKTPSTTKANKQTKAMSCQCSYSMGIISLKHRNYKLRMWVELMAVPVLSGEFLRGVGVAIFALVRTGVILPDVLAHHAATGRPLPLVGHLLLLYGRRAVVQKDGTRWSSLWRDAKIQRRLPSVRDKQPFYYNE